MNIQWSTDFRFHPRVQFVIVSRRERRAESVPVARLSSVAFFFCPRAMPCLDSNG